MADALPSRLVHHAPRETHLSNIIGKEKEKKVRFDDSSDRASNLVKLSVASSDKCRLPHEGVIIKDKKTGELLPFGEHQVHKVQDTTVVQETEEVRLKGKLRWLFEQDRMFWESNETKAAASDSKNVDEEAQRPSEQQPKANEAYSKSKPRMFHGGSKGEGLRSSSFKMPAASVGLLHEGVKGQNEKGSFRPDKDRKCRQKNHKLEELTHCEASFSNGEEFEFARECSFPIENWEFIDAKGSWDEGSGAAAERPEVSCQASEAKDTSKSVKLQKSASLNLHWGFNKSKAAAEESFKSEKASKGPSRARRDSPDQKAFGTPNPQHQQQQQQHRPKVARLSELRQTRVEREAALAAAEVSELDLGRGDAYFTDYEDAAGNSRHSSSEDEDETDDRTKVGAAGYVEGTKDRTTLLKAKCDLLAKEKDIAVRKWKRSCVEIDQAAQMAQALRTAIETLLEVSVAGEATSDFKSKRTTLEDHTRVLKARMEKLRRKSAELHPHPEPEDLLNVSLQGRIDTLKKSSEIRGLASPEIPRDTENKVEDLKARLEKLMLATNSRVTDEREHVVSRPREKRKKSPKDSVNPEKAELKMKGWYNSLSAELSAELTANLIESVQPNNSIDKCDVSSENGHTREPSYSVTPVTSKQVSPLHPLHHLEDTASTHSSEETKIRVIHKIAEEVRAESEQWYQVQDLLQRVGEDMKRLQEACSTWEQRALVAEAQVLTMQHEERRERLQTGDQKIAQLQTEMVRLRDTVDEVRKQLSSVDPSRWFEAANKFGYAFVPVMKPSLSGNYSFRHHSYPDDDGREPRDDRARGGEMRQKSAAVDADMSSDHWHPSSSTPPGAVTGDGAGIREKASRPLPARRNTKLPSLQWANEIARAEEDEILQSKMLGMPAESHQLSRLDFVKSSVTEEDISSPGRPDNSSRTEKSPKPRLDVKCDDFSRDESKEALPLSPIPKESTTDELLRSANLTSITRSPLKVVLGNVAPSKENKKPF
ncbi:hypothetical protein Mapa_009801 [Marchantia paleacea]|nr:hypothetical protein Mapa_009801 [Marchantia paleacea]